MDLHATEVTRWVDSGLTGLAFGNEQHCFVIQRSIEPERALVQGYYLSTEESVLTVGGILSLSVFEQTLRLQLSSQAAEHLGLPETLLIDLSQTGEAEGAIIELALMAGITKSDEPVAAKDRESLGTGQLTLFV